MMSAPEMPSIIAWWLLLTRAKRPSCNPVTSHVCQRGRSRSNGRETRLHGEGAQSVSVPGGRSVR